MAVVVALLAATFGLPTFGASASSSVFTGSVDKAGTAWSSHTVTLTEPAVFDISLNWDDPAADLNVFIKDPDGEIAISTKLETVRPELVSYYAQTPGDWKVGVQAKTGAANYEALVEVSPARVDEYRGTVTEVRSEWSSHTFDAIAPATIVATLEWEDVIDPDNHLPANLNLYLKSPSDIRVAEATARAGLEDTLSYNINESGEWTVSVKAQAGAGAYTVRVHHLPVTDAGTVGDRVWLDSDEDGIQGPDEPGVLGVNVRLFDDIGGEVAATTTAADGSYLLVAPPGDYYIQFDPPLGYSFTAANQGGDTNIDSDAQAVTGVTAPFAIGVGAYDTSIDAGLTADGDIYSGAVDVDAGPAAQNHPFTVTGPSTIKVTLDWDEPDADLNIILKDPSGATVLRTRSTTDNPEMLSLPTTTPGTWTVQVRSASGGANYNVTVLVVPEAPTTEDWPMFGHDVTHSLVTSDTSISASNANQLEVLWQTHAGDSVFSSPAVVYNETIGSHVVYAGTQSGYMSAFHSRTGEQLWAFHTPGSDIASSPAVVDGVVYFGSTDDHVYALDATTGLEICSFDTGGNVVSSPAVVDVDGTGKVIYISDNGITGADDGGAVWAIEAVDPNAAADCTERWSYDNFGAPAGSSPTSGSWSPPAIATDKTGRDLVVFGSSSPDNAVYALDASNGSRVWRFQSEIFNQDNDVGAGPTISAPGVNGFVDGVAYIAGKNRIVYALNLETGAKIWQFAIRDDSPTAGGATRSTMAMVGDKVYIGYGAGVYALDAVTGEKVWRSEDVGPRTFEILSSPAIGGPAGDQVLFVGDAGGDVLAFDLATGEQVWQHNTGALIYGSAAIADDRVFMPSASGFLAAFGFDTGVGDKPDTVIASPADGTSPDNPDGDLTISGTASDDDGVDRVLVAIKDINSNDWWHAASGSWRREITYNPTTLSNPDGKNTNWSLDFPIGFDGSVFYSVATAVDSDGQHDPTPDQSNFVIGSLGDPPDTEIVSPIFRERIYFPDGVRGHIPIEVTGTAIDSGGANPGIDKVFVIIRNIEHAEHYCGFPNCNAGAHDADWTAATTILEATLDDPGAISTDWSISFPSYDHPHKYRITAWAVDLDGEEDSSRAVNARVCVRDVGDPTCA